MAIALAAVESDLLPGHRAALAAAAFICADQPRLLDAVLHDWGICDAMLKEADVEAKSDDSPSGRRVNSARRVLEAWHGR